jgi:Glycosyl hydrolases family 43/Carbohydrate binding module (family 6)
MKNIMLFLSLCCLTAKAQNPFVTDQFTADPSARVFEGKVYVYPSHDIPCQEGQGYIGFCMEDYHVFSSDNLTQWQDHGVILDQKSVPWVNATTYSMWAPDCIFKNGKYYLFFPAISKEEKNKRRIGVAISDKPYGPFIPETNFIEGIEGIDPNPFIDKDGQAYLYWGGGENLQMAKLKDTMLELASSPEMVVNLPPKFKEGSYVFERKGKYYFTFPHVTGKTEKLDYAMGDNPMGPFTFAGTIMDESASGCWTNHHSILEFKEQWYLFYHDNDLSPNFDKNRSIRIDNLYFNADGTIRKVIPTLRGVGTTPAKSKIQIDRYSYKSEDDVAISFLDESNKKQGWKTTLKTKNAWIRYDKVDFGTTGFKKIFANVKSKNGGAIEIILDDVKLENVAELKLDKSDNWKELSFKTKEKLTGIHNVILTLRSDKEVEIDWISFQ